MFFDFKQKDEIYEQYLIAIAKKQKELFYCKFDIEARVEKIFEKTGLFKKKCPELDYYNKLLLELDELKNNLIAHRKAMGYKSGTFWWNIPWEQIEKYLLYDLTETRSNGKWRYEYNWRTIEAEDGVFMLILEEEGHYSNFSSERSYEYEKLSKYSEAEQAEMVRKFNNRQDMYALADMSIGDSIIHSLETDKYYASKKDYYNSTEYIVGRMYMSDKYAQSLYTEHETSSVVAYSNSLHYKCAFAVANYHLKNNNPDYVYIENFKYISGTGHLDKEIEYKYSTIDAAIALAFYFSSCEDVTNISLGLFGENIEKGASSYDEAIRQAEIYTLIADKIKI